MSTFLSFKLEHVVEKGTNVSRSATVFANAIMHAGTTLDTFLRENLQWLSNSTNWAKFSDSEARVYPQRPVEARKIAHGALPWECCKFESIFRRRSIVWFCITLSILESTERIQEPDYSSTCQLLMFLDKVEDIAGVFERLLKSDSQDEALLAFQVAFDLVENEHQSFLLSVRDRLLVNVSMDEVYAGKLARVNGILCCEISIDVALQFLFSQNKSDPIILNTSFVLMINLKQNHMISNLFCLQ